MHKRSASPAHIIIALLLAYLAAAVTSEWLALLIMPQTFCSNSQCMANLLVNPIWWAQQLVILIATAALLTAYIKQPRSPNTRFWPLITWLLFSVGLCGLHYGGAALFHSMRPLNAPQFSLNTSQRIGILLLNSPLPTLVVVALCGWLTRRLCFEKNRDPGGTSLTHGQRGLLFFLGFATITTTTFSLLVIMPPISVAGLLFSLLPNGHNSYALLSMGALATGLLLALPVGLTAWWCHGGRRQTTGTLLLILLTLLLSLLFMLIIVALSTTLIHNLATLVAGAKIIAGLWLLVNGLTTWLVCWLWGSHTPTPPHSIARRLVMAVCITLALGVLAITATTIKARTGIGSRTGLTPLIAATKPAIRAQMGDSYATDSNCSGVVSAAGDIWLLGNNDHRRSLNKVAAASQAVDLTLDPASGQPAYRGMAVTNTVVSRLMPDHRFRALAYLPAAACIVAAPDGHSVYLLTGLDTLSTNTQLSQSNNVIFVSHDRGRHWQPAALPAFAAAKADPYMGHYVYADATTLWVWERNTGGLTVKLPTIAVTSHQGGSVSRPTIPSSFRVALKQLPASLLAQGATPSNKGITPGTSFITAAGPGRATLWLSYRYFYRLPGATHAQRMSRTASLPLRLDNGQWVAQSPRIQDDAYISKLVQVSPLRAFAVIRHPQAGNTSLARLRRGHWQNLNSLPNPFWPLPAAQRVRGLWASAHAIVVTLEARMFMLGIKGGNSTWYSTDNGRHWQRLKIVDWPGVLGIDAANDRLYFQNFDSDGLTSSAILRYDLTELGSGH